MTPAKLIDREIALIATSHCPLSQASFCRGLVVMASTAKKISFARRAELERQIDHIDQQQMNAMFARCRPSTPTHHEKQHGQNGRARTGGLEPCNGSN